MRSTNLLLWLSSLAFTSAAFVRSSHTIGYFSCTNLRNRSNALLPKIREMSFATPNNPSLAASVALVRSEGLALQFICTTTLDGCKRRCLSAQGCKSFAYNARKSTCITYGQTLRDQGYTFRASGATRYYGAQCFAYEQPPPPAAPTNIIKNPSFEMLTNDIPDDWTFSVEDDEADDDRLDG